MDNLKKGLASALLVMGMFVVSLAGGLLANKPEQQAQIQPVEVKVLGAMPGNSLSILNELEINGVNTIARSSTMNRASTTLCSLKSPAATSTLAFASFAITTGSSTATTIDIGKDRTVPTATTTLLASNYSLAANALANVVASSTIGIDEKAVFGPNEYLNVKYGGLSCTGSTNCNSYVGTCKATFIQN